MAWWLVKYRDNFNVYLLVSARTVRFVMQQWAENVARMVRTRNANRIVEGKLLGKCSLEITEEVIRGYN
jgi:hypothetical protein